MLKKFNFNQYFSEHSAAVNLSEKLKKWATLRAKGKVTGVGAIFFKTLCNLTKINRGKIFLTSRKIY